MCFNFLGKTGRSENLGLENLVSQRPEFQTRQDFPAHLGYPGKVAVLYFAWEDF